jgi:mannosyltransferase OCH1-like enzyme
LGDFKTMIPKRIITAWYGRGEKNDLFKRCMASWPLHNPAWEILEINEDNCGVMGTPYMQSVYARREFVKCTEIARLIGVHTYGGLYLDCDMEVLRPLEPLLATNFFVRQQDGCVNGAMFGAEAGNPVLGDLIAAFPLNSRGEMPALDYGPLFLSKQLDQRRDFAELLPVAAFPFFWNEKDPGPPYPPASFAVHRWAGSWAK